METTKKMQWRVFSNSRPAAKMGRADEVYKNGRSRSSGSRGLPTRRCRLWGPRCSLQTALEGCHKLQPCRLREEQERPRLDYQKCAELSPGQSCQVNCLVPSEGPGFEVRCPADHTVLEGAPLSVAEPNCTLPCPMPEPIPYGYANASGEWCCYQGYAGEIKLIRVFDSFPFCQRRVELRGQHNRCYRMVPCANLELPPEVDKCELNLTDCQGRGTNGKRKERGGGRRRKRKQIEMERFVDLTCRDAGQQPVAVLQACPAPSAQRFGGVFDEHQESFQD